MSLKKLKCADLDAHNITAYISNILKSEKPIYSLFYSLFNKLPTDHNSNVLGYDYIYTLEVLSDLGYEVINGTSYYKNNKFNSLDKEYSDGKNNYYSEMILKNNNSLIELQIKYSSSAITTRKKKGKMKDILYVEDIVIWTDVSKEMEQYSHDLFKKLEKYKIEFNTGNSINIIIQTSEGLDCTPLVLPEIKLDVELNYGKDFLKTYDIIKNALNTDNTKSGIILLHGVPGSGKSKLIQHLISITEKTVLYIPPHLVTTLADPNFITFLMDYEDCVLVIEDAENAIQSRNGEYSSPAVSNLLNMSDGILGSALKLKIIATFNSDKNDIDEALLRPGRLIAEHCFEKLGAIEATKLFKHLGKDIIAEHDMTLAEIYNYDIEKPVNQSKPKRNKIGFNN